MSKDKKTAEPAEKVFGLKPIEINMVNALQQTHMSNISNYLSVIALDRLAYEVTQNTQFRIEGDKLYIKENEPKAEAPAEEVAVA